MDALLVPVQIVLMLVFAPLVQGVIKTSKARWQMRRGPGVLQPYRDIAKLMSRESVQSDRASWVFTIAPIVYAAALISAAVLIPTISERSAVNGIADAILFVALLALGRFALALAGLDTASNFGGMGSSREVTFSALIEPAIMLVIFAIALPIGTTNLTSMTGADITAVAKILAFGALLIATITETGRVPIDNPDTHLELTMVHEGMILEYSGRSLGILHWATQVKQLAFLALLAALFVPWGMAAPGDHSVSALGIGLGAFAIKVIVLGLLLGVIETSVAKLRIFKAPDLIGFASVLGVLAVLASYVVER